MSFGNVSATLSSGKKRGERGKGRHDEEPRKLEGRGVCRLDVGGPPVS